MRAAIYDGPGRDVAIRRIPDPVPQPDELLIEIARCGICGSDVSMTGGGIGSKPGRCFGHEYSGTVIETGKDVAGWRPGDRVACIPSTGCGSCAACRAGRVILCPNGRSNSAGFAELIAVPAVSAIRLPQTLSLADGALIEPMACGLHALNMAGGGKGMRILILGAGAMALSLIWWARKHGAASVVVASRSPHRASLCEEFGATSVHSFAEDDPGSLQTRLGGAADIVAECVGKPGLLNLALDHVRPGGTVVSMGMCDVPEAIVPARLAFTEAKLCFPLGYSPSEFVQTARTFDADAFHPEAMIGEVLPLAQLPDALRLIRSGKIAHKVHIAPGL